MNLAISTLSATHHNNPAFIAGFLAGYFGAALNFAVLYPYSNGTAIAQYSTIFADKPISIYISYVNLIGKRHQSTLPTLGAKSMQVGLLLELLQTFDIRKLNFYDDDIVNAHSVGELSLRLPEIEISLFHVKQCISPMVLVGNDILAGSLDMVFAAAEVPQLCAPSRHGLFGCHEDKSLDGESALMRSSRAVYF